MSKVYNPLLPFGFDETGTASASQGSVSNPFPLPGIALYDNGGMTWILMVGQDGRLYTEIAGGGTGLLLALTNT